MAASLSPVGRFERILLAADGTEFSEGAQEVALSMAGECGARLYLLRVVITNPEYEAMAPDRVEAEAEAARGFLEAFSRRCGDKGVVCETILRHGTDPYLETVAAAEDVRADVIVIGRRTRSDLARLMMGDSTAKVIGHAPCSVLVVPCHARMPEKRILVATDGSRLGDAASVAASNLARSCKLPLTVVSVDVPGHSEERRLEAAAAIDRVREALRDDPIEVTGVQEEGRPDEVIVDVAVRQGADLIVVGSHGRTGLQRLLMGSVSERVIGRAEVAVLVVK
ncbi:universal stress protein [Thioalkalivibrio denitrificans]|uniref:Universal stress protein n=1 Tax=Thioalkalivibrio denitrificans TaxID=108003 RepID=A0A1V3NGH7_9GAMM|nr:universal stress protein [Thioalkalivibrio denitrificans]OOG23978.1 universal stress protein [Thioalkalivibrio denitrificans]